MLVCSPELIHFLQGQNPVLQDRAAWVIGNLAGDGPEFRDALLSQGVAPPLVALLQVRVCYSRPCVEPASLGLAHTHGDTHPFPLPSPLR